MEEAGKVEAEAGGQPSSPDAAPSATEPITDTTATTSTSVTITATEDSSDMSKPRRPVSAVMSTSSESPRVQEEIKRRREANRRKKELAGQHSRSVELKASTIRQHYYPEGGFGWVVLGAACVVHALTSGFQFCFGLFAGHLRGQAFVGAGRDMQTVWLGSMSHGVSLLVAPIVIAFCRKKSARLTGIISGLLAALGLLFTSFASQLHQVFVSFLVLGVALGAAREVAHLMVGQYFKRRREKVEIFLQSSQGIGMAIVAPMLHFSLITFGWQRGLQLVAACLFTCFVVGTLYRSASLYHPQRRAILHLKTQRRKIREKGGPTDRTPFFDFSTLASNSIRLCVLAGALAAFGLLTPLFYLADACRRTSLDSPSRTSPINSTSPSPELDALRLHVSIGLSFATGVVFYGLLVVRTSAECRIARKYLVQSTMACLALLAATMVALPGQPCSGPHAILLNLYGAFLGGFFYTLKMLVFERTRARFFNRAWAFVEGAQSLPLLIGIPISGYLSTYSELDGKAGLLFAGSGLACGAVVLCFMPAADKKRASLSSSLGHKAASPKVSGSYIKDTLDGVPPINSLSDDNGGQKGGSDLRRGSSAIASECYRCGQHFLVLCNDKVIPLTSPSPVATPVVDIVECPQPPLKKKRGSEEFDDDDEDFDEDLVALSKLHPDFNHDLGTFFSEDLMFAGCSNCGQEEAREAAGHREGCPHHVTHEDRPLLRESRESRDDNCDNLATAFGRGARRSRLAFETVAEER